MLSKTPAMRYTDLTLPLDHEWMPDEVFPTALHYYLGPKFHPDKGIVIGSDTGTCLTLPAQFTDFRKTTRIDEVPVEKLFLRPTAVLDIPKGAGAGISGKEIQEALDTANPERGDAILIRTGWGDTGAHAKPGSRYMLESPHLSVEAAQILAERMNSHGQDLLLMDTALIGWPNKHLIPEWCSLEPRPGPWPSAEARVYLHLYTAGKMKEDFAVELVLAGSSVMTVKKLVGCRVIGSARIRIIVSPLRVVRGVAANCRVIAVEE